MAQVDLFAVFGLPHHLRLDVAQLEKDFYARSRKLHPDRFAARPIAEQEAALVQSSQLNDAYRTLRDPIARTQHLLHLEGVELEEQSKAATEAARASGTEKKQLIPPELLEEVFDLNMQLAELKAAQQFGEEPEPEVTQGLLAAKQSFDARLQSTQAELERLWAAWDTALDASPNASDDPAAPARVSARESLVALLNKRSYLRNLVRDVDAALAPA